MAKHHGDASMVARLFIRMTFGAIHLALIILFNQLRVTLTYDLLQKGGFISPSQIISPRMATDEEIAYIHTEEYINAVKRAGEGKLENQLQ